jgi:oligopeptidase B
MIYIPPIAKKNKKELVSNGHSRTDNYYWLKERENPEVIDYLNAENEYTTAILKDSEGLQEKLYTEIVGRIKQTDISVPYLMNGYFYYTRFEEGKDYPVYCRKEKSLDNPEEIMLNANEMAVGHEYFQISGITVSPNNSIIADLHHLF